MISMSSFWIILESPLKTVAFSRWSAKSGSVLATALKDVHHDTTDNQSTH